MVGFERGFKLIMRPWFVACYLSLVVLSFLYFDKPIAWFFYGMGLREALPVLHYLTQLGTGEYYIVALLLLAVCFRYIVRNKTFEMRSWFLWLCVFFPYSICAVLKLIVGRARPQLLFDSNLFGFYGLHFNHPYWSFPSGHTTTITGLVCGLTVLFPKYCYAFIISGILLVSTRVILTNHYLSDVMMTAFLTLLEIGALFYLLRRQTWLDLKVI